jgi:hypothetical protein
MPYVHFRFQKILMQAFFYRFLVQTTSAGLLVQGISGGYNCRI